MASPRSLTYTVLPSSITLGHGCISLMPWHWSTISSIGVPRLRCSETKPAGQFRYPVL